MKYSRSAFIGKVVPLSVSMSIQYDPLYWLPYYFEQSINLNSFEIICKIDLEIGIKVT